MRNEFREHEEEQENASKSPKNAPESPNQEINTQSPKPFTIGEILGLVEWHNMRISELLALLKNG